MKEKIIILLRKRFLNIEKKYQDSRKAIMLLSEKGQRESPVPKNEIRTCHSQINSVAASVGNIFAINPTDILVLSLLIRTAIKANRSLTPGIDYLA